MVRTSKRISPTRDRIQADYFQWLCKKIRVDEPDHSYWILAKELYKKEFYSLIEKDFNRESDGIELRRDYMFDSGNWSASLVDAPCSVFEMLIGLAEKIDGMLSEGESEDQSYIYFWEMITNLGLDDVTDDKYAEYGPFYISERLDKFLERKYTMKGKGNIFPMKYSKKDQRKIEIWYQMQEYLLENYPI